ncbi:limonene-1,2-epoxide hydrolase family protein [soil metagenome]
MPTGLLPTAPPADGATLTDPQAVTEAFLAALAASDLDGAMALLATDVLYVNVGTPAIRSRAKVAKAFAGLTKPEVGFEAYLHAISADGPVVLTERTDVIVVGRFRAQFWVTGRFDVHDGQITLWRDSFDFVDILRGVVRGLAGAVLPGLKPAAPTSLDDAPGR